MRSLKAAGVIAKIPGGRRPKEHATAYNGKPDMIEKARAVVANVRSELPLVPGAPWQDQTHAEKLATLTGKALDTTLAILDLPCAPDNLKLLSIQKDAALSLLSTQVKVDQNRLREREGSAGRLNALLEELAALTRAG
jgi:hypothetical protein